LRNAKDLRFFRRRKAIRALSCEPGWKKTTMQGSNLMEHNESNDLFDSDALLYIGRPYWFDRHPSQAEGEDF